MASRRTNLPPRPTASRPLAKTLPDPAKAEPGRSPRRRPMRNQARRSIDHVGRQCFAELLDRTAFLIADRLGGDAPARGDLGRCFTLERGVNQSCLAGAERVVDCL